MLPFDFVVWTEETEDHSLRSTEHRFSARSHVSRQSIFLLCEAEEDVGGRVASMRGIYIQSPGKDCKS
jgi:hypothetical protein